MLAGRNKVRIAIWGAVEIGRDPVFNTPVVEERKVKDTWAHQAWRRGRESIDGSAKPISNTIAYFTIRLFSCRNVNTANWLVVKGSDGVDQVYNIIDVQPDIQDRDKLVIEARVRDINLTAE
jgi:hypothetical protein